MTTSTNAKPKALSTTEISRRASAFVAKWKNETRENAEAQTWWNEFFGIFGVDRYSTATFERWARRASTGNQGRIDVFMPGVMIAEHKSLGKDGGKAEGQADDYLAGGDISPTEMPRYIVSTDFAEVQITDLESPADPAFRFPIAKLPKHIGRFAFLAGYNAPVRKTVEHEAVSIKAARKMGELYEALLGDLDATEETHDAEQAAIFMTRLLFLMYGDDTEGLWEPDAFQNFIEQCTVEDGSDTGPQIAYLFQILDKPKDKRPANLDDHLKFFPYVNGGLFRERIDIPTFNKPMRDALLAAMNVEWAEVSPAIFGSLFQGMATREQRRADGEHYTSELNILKTLRPLFLDELEENLKDAWHSERELTKIHASLADMRYLDPACGAGNFLIVAYREMRDLELRLLIRLRELRGNTQYSLDGTWELNVRPEQFAGIEINGWPAKIAATALFLVDHQANQRMALELGSAPERLPIKNAANIVHANALKVDWNKAIEANNSTFVFGNPPFLGKAQRSREQTDDMRTVWGASYSGEMDFVTAWFVGSANYLRGTTGRFALVSTNSIAQGASVPPLFGMLRQDSWRVRFAHRTFSWASEASGQAAVHCVITGFDKGGATPRLFDYMTAKGEPQEIPGVGNINGYLADGENVLIGERSGALNPTLQSSIRFGSMAADGGHLMIYPDTVEEVLADPIARKYLRPFVGAKELIQGLKRWCIWMPTPVPSDIASSPFLRERFAEVKASRLDAKDPGVKRDEAAPYRFHRVQQPVKPYLCIPRHFSEDRLYATVAYVQPDVIAGDANFTVDDPDGYLFAVISSTMFITWQKTVGGRLESRPRFASTLAWNNYPLPTMTESARGQVIAAGQSVLAARRLYPEQSLASLYNPLSMPTELLQAHDALDRVTDRIFGFSKKPTLAQRQVRLFALYVEMDEADKRAQEEAKAAAKAAVKEVAAAKRAAAKLAKTAQ